MSKLGELVEKHPYATGGAVIGGGLVIILLLRSGGSSSDSTAALASSEINAQTQLAAVNAQESAQVESAQLNEQAQQASVNAQASAANTQTIGEVIASVYGAKQQTAQAQIAGNVQNTETADSTALQEQSNSLSANVLNKETSAALEATEAGYNEQEQSNTLAAKVANNQIDAATEVAENNNATGLAETNSANSLSLALANLQTQLGMTQLSDQTSLADQQLNDQFNQNQQIIQEVGAAGLNHGTASLEGDLSSILESIEGQSGPAATVAASGNAASASQSQSTAALWASITKSLSQLGASLFG